MKKITHKLFPCVNRGGRQSLTPTLNPSCKGESKKPANDMTISNIVRTTNFPEIKGKSIDLYPTSSFLLERERERERERESF
jgi:hypothetical protein